MSNQNSHPGTALEDSKNTAKARTRRTSRMWAGSATLATIVAVSAVAFHLNEISASTPPVAVPPPSVAVSKPLQRSIEPRIDFLGQFSAVQRVELRAQVGGTLTEIRFRDGDVVHKGDLLFVIDTVPYEIKMSQANAQLASANARLDLATREFTRAQMLKNTDAGTVENVDQKSAEKQAALAAVEAAKAAVRDAKFDLDHCRIVAPFTGRIGTHLVSVGNLVAGSRGATSPTTLLTTIVSLDPVYLDFDMSEHDYMIYMRSRANGASADNVAISLSDETSFSRKGTLNFVDNTLDRSSGTIHARAIVENKDLLLTPGGFARVRLSMSTPQPALLVPDAAVLADQSEHMVLTVGPNDVVAPKRVEIGELRGGLRVIRSGLTSADNVIIDGIPIVAPGAKVSPHVGSIQFQADKG